MQHAIVYREPRRCAAWPANYGIWAWGDEIVVGFTSGHLNIHDTFHARDKSRPFETLQARSMDGGESWSVTPFPGRTPGGRGLSADEHMHPGLQVAELLDGPEAPAPPPGGIDFTHPDFALMCARSGLVAGARSWFYVSTNRCRSWQGPYALPTYDQAGIAARTDYVALGREACLLFLTATKSNGDEGRPFCVKTTDGGRSFPFLAWIGPEPAEGHAIMPASVALGPDHLLTAVRRSGKPHGFIDLYESRDGGRTWAYSGKPVADTGRGGNPPTLTRLADGRLCITYGFRAEPYGIRAVLSDDAGRTWGEPLVLRADAGNHDIGYPRTVQRADGKLVTVYYYNDDPDGERYIGATIWEA
ncbi:MAG TPA: sialidase family protein [Limnochordia bacterium]|nr:sialidase family protein [Limnochordia bacterium]